MRYLIGNDGTVWVVGSPDLRRHLGNPTLDIDLERYAIENLGFVGVYFPADAMRIRLRRDFFPDKPLHRLITLAVKLEPRRIVIEYTDEITPPDLLGNWNDALARLDEVRGAGAGPRRLDWFSEELDFDRLSHRKRASMRRLLQTWRRMRGRLGRTGEIPQSFDVLEGRHLLVRMTDSGRSILQSWGSKFTCYPGVTPDDLIGRDLEDQPDREYGRVSAEAYQRVARATAPRLELVEAIVRPPDAPPVRMRYERLLLPWTTDGGDTFVSGTSVVRLKRPAIIMLAS